VEKHSIYVGYLKKRKRENIFLLFDAFYGRFLSNNTANTAPAAMIATNRLAMAERSICQPLIELLVLELVYL